MKLQNIFTQLSEQKSQIDYLERRIIELEQQLTQMIRIERNHLLRIKNDEKVPDDFIENGRKYLDLTPEKAWKLYLNRDYDFIFLDVSEVSSKLHTKIPEAIHIPWSEFEENFIKIQNKTTPILIISEDGTTSILACEFLAKHGFYNCNNISGGHLHWRGSQFRDINGETA